MVMEPGTPHAISSLIKTTCHVNSAYPVLGHAHVVLLMLSQVFDVTNRPSFESLSSWMAEAAKYGAPAKMVRAGQWFSKDWASANQGPGWH